MKRLLCIVMLVLSSMATACEKQTPEQQLAKLKAKAAAGNATAQSNLGFMYANGESVPEDYVQAYKWYNLAAASADTSAAARARRNKDRVAAKMTKEQIAEAQRLSTAFTPTTTP